MIIDKLKAKLNKNKNLTKKIEELGFTDRTYHCLRRAGIATVGDLVRMSWKDLMGCRNVVRKTCEEIERVLDGMGLGLRKDDK
jgi:DNA-directed RNA polymerase, alpha subunit/40 kD subunit